MNQTVRSDRSPVDLSLAEGYSRRKKDGSFRLDEVKRVQRDDDALASPSGGYVSNATDLQRFSTALSSGLLMGDLKTSEALLDPFVIREGMASANGFDVRETALGKAIGHSGALVGYSSEFFVLPDLGWSIVILANHDSHASNVLNYILEILPQIEQSSPAWPSR